MYLEYVNYQNIGAIYNLKIKFSFSEDGSPKPIIFVGENGSGKSILLSNIVDAFYEFASKAYTNVYIQEGMQAKYYKVISPIQISYGKKYLAAYLRFSDGGQRIEYIFKSGKKSWNDYNCEQFGDSPLNAALKWNNDDDNHKSIVIQEQKTNVKRIFSNNAICYFPPDRYEKPPWLSDSYHTSSVRRVKAR